jgi:hypothetical protein
MTAYAVVFVHKPPSLSDVFALVFRAIEIVRRKSGVDTTKQKGRELRDFLGLQLEIGHSQLFQRSFHFPSIINSRIFQFVLKESFMLIPALVFGFVSE